MGQPETIILTTSQLAEVFGKTARWVNMQTHDGVFVQSGRGKYALAENVQRYVDSLQKRPEGAGEVNLNREKALHEAVKREMAEMELAAMKGEMHRSEDVKLVMNDMIAAFRSRILVMPPKIAPQLIGLTDLAAVRSVLDRECREALTELSDYDPAVFYARSKDYKTGTGPDDSTG